MPTTNKNLDQPALNATNWNTPLNGNFGIIDDALGGVTSINATGVGTTPVVLTTAQYQKLVLNFTGTLTANVTYQIPSGVGGQWIVANNTTGAFTLTIDNVAVGSSAVVPSGARRIVYSDGTNVFAADNSIATVGAAGNVAYSDGAGLTGSPQLAYSGGQLRAGRDDASTATVLSALRVARSTSGVAANGIGTGLQFAVENNAGSEVVGGLLSLVADDVVAGSEDFRFAIQLMAGGAAATTVAEITPTQVLIAGNAALTTRGATGTAVQDLQYAGFTAQSDDDGTFSSGTYTPTPVGGNFKRIVNGGAFTLAAPSAAGDYTLIVQISNTTGAGAITLSGFTRSTGDTFTTNVAHRFLVFITKVNGFTMANVQALQ